MELDILSILISSFMWSFIAFKLKQIKSYVTLLDKIMGIAVSLTLSVTIRFLIFLAFGF